MCERRAGIYMWNTICEIRHEKSLFDIPIRTLWLAEFFQLFSEKKLFVCTTWYDKRCFVVSNRTDLNPALRDEMEIVETIYGFLPLVTSPSSLIQLSTWTNSVTKDGMLHLRIPVLPRMTYSGRMSASNIWLTTIFLMRGKQEKRNFKLIGAEMRMN